MSLFGIKPVTESTVFEGSHRYMGETVELDEILFEAAKDIHQIQGGLYVADIMMESQVVYEGASEEVLLEGVVKDFFDKLIEAFRKLWNKIKAWFQQVYKSIELLFADGAKLVKKFGKEIHAKDTNGYTYKGYNWKKDAVAALYDLRKVEKEEVPSFSSIEQIIEAADVPTNKEGKVTSEEVQKANKEYLREVASADNISELKENILEQTMGGSTEKEEIENFSVYSVTEMMNFLKDHKKLVDKLKKAEKNNNRTCDNVIKGFTNLKKELSTEDQAKYSSTISNCATAFRNIIAVNNAMVSCAIIVAKKQNSEFVGALKGLLRYKPAKEGFGYMGGSNNSSLLESAMGLI